jgi:integrase/recombinase XerD
LYIRWLQEVRRFRPSTVSRRLSVVAGFYRTCVIDGVLEHSPTDHVRRPNVPPESPTLGLSHLQFEALLTAARESANPNDFALVAMLGLLGLRIFETTASNIDDLGEEHGHLVLRVMGKGSRVVLVPLPPAVGRAMERAVADRMNGPILLNTRGTRMDRHAATRRLRHLPAISVVRLPRMHPHELVPAEIPAGGGPQLAGILIRKERGQKVVGGVSVVVSSGVLHGEPPMLVRVEAVVAVLVLV